jgi:hypothetical protein
VSHLVQDAVPAAETVPCWQAVQAAGAIVAAYVPDMLHMSRAQRSTNLLKVQDVAPAAVYDPIGH